MELFELLTSQPVNDGLEWIIVMSISAVWHPFTAEDPLRSNFFTEMCSYEETNSSTSWSEGELFL